MTEKIVLLLVLNSLTYAAVLFVMASGLTLAFNLMRVVNLAHGAFYLVGGYVGLSVLMITGNWGIALIAGGLTMAGVSIVIERFLLSQVRGNLLAQALLTLSLAIILADVSLAVWGGDPISIPSPTFLNSPIYFFGIIYPGFRFFILLIGIIIGVGLWFLLKKTKLGMAIRASVDNREIASATGVNVDRLSVMVFALSAFLGGVAGVIGGSFLALAPGEDFKILTLTLVVVIMGGMGSFGGTIIGALIISLILSIGRLYVPQFSIFLTFVPMVLVLSIWPHGLFGREK